MKQIYFLFLIIIFNVATAFSDVPYVLVSVAPHKFFVEKIAGDTVTVGLMVPAGASAHTYEPTPKQTLAASKADLWFVIGENFEARASRSLMAHNPSLQLVDLRQGLDMIKADPFTGACCCCHQCGQDLHIWLSSRQAQIQARTIAQALSQRYPQHAEKYRQALGQFVLELQDLDRRLGEMLKPLKTRVIMVSHPAYAYFCRDYQLKQLPIECEGKDPTPLQLTNILNTARAAHIKKVFVQPQYSSKGAKLLAKELDAQVVVLDPYSEDYISTMLQIGSEFSHSEN